MLFYKISIIIFVFSATYNNASSSAWVQRQGESQVITTYGLTSANVDADKYYNPKIQHSTYKSSSLSLYTEYGLTNKITVGVNSMASSYEVRNHAEDKYDIVNAINFTELYLRQKIYSNKSFILSMQYTYLMPNSSYKLQSYQSPFYHNSGHEIKILLGHSESLQDGGLMRNMISQKEFFNLEFGFRRFNAPYNEARLNFSYGIVAKDFDFDNIFIIDLAKINRFYSSYLSESRVYSTISNPQFKRDDINRITASMFIGTSKQTYISIGFFSEIKSKYIGNGDLNTNAYGVLVGFLYNS